VISLSQTAMVKRVVKMCISMVFLLFSEICRIACVFKERGCPYPFVVLTYHVVGKEEAELFSRQMDDIERLAEPVSASLQGLPNARTRRIAVTFDDAFRCIVDNAVPEVSKRNIPITIFVPMGYLGKNPRWIPDPNHEYLSEVVLTADELKCLPAERVSIGSHTVSHPDLSKLNDDALDEELKGSKHQLEELLGREVNLLAFPFGAYDARVLRHAQKAGFTRVFSNLPRLSRANGETYLVGRIGADPSDWPLEFRLKIRGAYRWLSMAVSMKRRLLRFGHV
jgi:peptidoglycan/xylan/chitin deacetylase (PgdA/CDA1 family)